MDPNCATRGELSIPGLKYPEKARNRWIVTLSVGGPGLSLPPMRPTDDDARAGIDHATASRTGGELASETDPATRRRALLHRGAGSAVLVALAMIGRRACGADVMIAIDNFTFSPTPLGVARGTTVGWTNRDDIPHAILCPALGLRSQPLETNDVFRHRFDQAGTFDYICSIHPNMRGRIVVSGI